MKASKILMAAAALAVVVACGPKGEKASVQGADSLSVQERAADLKPSKAQRDSVSYLMGIVFGGYIKGYNFGDDVNFSQIEKGIKDFLGNKAPEGSKAFVEGFKISPELLDGMFNKYLQQRYMYVSALNRENEVKYLAKAEKDGYTKTESGLLYKIKEAGAETKLAPGDTLTVNYKGTLNDGRVFDSTEDRGEFEFVLQSGPRGVIPAWVEGLQLIGEGGSIALVAPSHLAYGAQGNRGIEPNTTLYFDIEVLSVKPFKKAEEAPAQEAE